MASPDAASACEAIGASVNRRCSSFDEYVTLDTSVGVAASFESVTLFAEVDDKLSSLPVSR